MGETQFFDVQLPFPPGRRSSEGAALPALAAGAHPRGATAVPRRAGVSAQPERPMTSSWARTGGLTAGPRSRPSTSGGLRMHVSSSLYNGRAQQRAPGQRARQAGGGAHDGLPLAFGSSSAARNLAGTAALKDFVRSPAEQTELMKDQVVDWMRGWDREVQSYNSVSVFAQLKLNELHAITAELPQPHPVHTAAVCHVFERVAGLFGRYESLIRPLWNEVLGCVYADAHLLGADALPLGACDRHLTLEPWFSKYDSAARRCAQLEQQLARGLRRQGEAHGAARVRDAQMANVVAGWQRELVRVKALAGADDAADAVRATLLVLEQQVRELAHQLAATQRELRTKEEELAAALRANAELHVPPPLDAEAADLFEIRRRFRSLPASAQGSLARELLAAAGSGGGGGPL
jgi:hypothetical protein